jgi:hypothetical protein
LKKEAKTPPYKTRTAPQQKPKIVGWNALWHSTTPPQTDAESAKAPYGAASKSHPITQAPANTRSV